AGPRSPTRPGAAPGAARPVAAEAMAAPVLLGGVPASGRPGPTSRTLTRHEHMSLGNARCRAVRMAWMAAAWLTVVPGRLAAQWPLEATGDLICGGGSGGFASEETTAPAVPVDLQVDVIAGPGSDGNGVLEPGEWVTVAPSWSNAGGEAITLSGV